MKDLYFSVLEQRAIAQDMALWSGALSSYDGHLTALHATPDQIAKAYQGMYSQFRKGTLEGGFETTSDVKKALDWVFKEYHYLQRH